MPNTKNPSPRPPTATTHQRLSQPNETVRLEATKTAQASGLGLFSETQECTLAYEIAKLEQQQAELNAMPTPVAEADIDAFDAKAVALGVAAGLLLDRISKKATFEVANLPGATLSNYVASVEAIKSSAKSARTTMATKRATLEAEAEAEAAAKAAAEAAAKAQAEAEAAAAAEAAAEEQRRADEAAAAAAAEAARKAAAKPRPFVGGGGKPAPAQPQPAPAAPPARDGGGAAYYKNCAAARAAGAAPVRIGQPGYGKHLDRDGDGVGCE